MKKEHGLIKLVIAWFVGGLIGGIVALHSPFAWYWGILVGGLISYTVYDFPNVIHAFGVVFGSEIPKAVNIVWTFNQFKAGTIVGVCLGVFLTVAFVRVTFALQPTRVFNSNDAIASSLMYTMMGVLGGAFGWALQPAIEEKFDSSWKFCFWLFKAPFLFLKWLIIGLWLVLKIIHSEKRLAAGVYGALGVIAGYEVGNALIGALIGVGLGTLSYYFWKAVLPYLSTLGKTTTA